MYSHKSKPKTTVDAVHPQDQGTRRADETKSSADQPDDRDVPTTQPRRDQSEEGGETPGYPQVPGYKIVGHLGSGACGRVFKAMDERGQIPCAIKQIVNADNILAEKKSLEAIRELQHHAIIDFRAFFVHDGCLYIVMPLAEDTLSGHLAKEHGDQGIPAKRLLGYFQDIAEGIDFLHAKGRVHRDIKPDNMVFVGGKVKVADFGTLAELNEKRRTISVEAFGTPGFMAPEVWDNMVSTRSDQYSLAVMYASLRMGRSPFQGGSTADFCDAHKYDDPDLSLIQDTSERAAVGKALSLMDSCASSIRIRVKGTQA